MLLLLLTTKKHPDFKLSCITAVSAGLSTAPHASLWVKGEQRFWVRNLGTGNHEAWHREGPGNAQLSTVVPGKASSTSFSLLPTQGLVRHPSPSPPGPCKSKNSSFWLRLNPQLSVPFADSSLTHFIQPQPALADLVTQSWLGTSTDLGHCLLALKKKKIQTVIGSSMHTQNEFCAPLVLAMLLFLLLESQNLRKKQRGHLDRPSPRIWGLAYLGLNKPRDRLLHPLRSRHIVRQLRLLESSS